MRTQKHSGFTIIEVMLFLAITGALTVGILVGSSVVIGQHRYRDSVNSFKGYVQDQYSQIANVVNSETKQPTCTRTGDTLELKASIPVARGTSECVVMGRFIFINGDRATAYNLVGQPPGSLPSGGDTAVLNTYALALQSPDEYEISWGARIVEPKSTTSTVASILIVRSPLSGSILTYILDGDRRSDVRAMLSDANMIQKDFCVDSNGSPIASRMAIRITARAANQSAIEIPLETDRVCD